jgi:DNA polymerase III subunit gamma/tau
MADPTPQPHDAGTGRAREYVVVARRYRPQVFEDLVGQEHVARALSNAITTHRVGHAYLFTGARGVGKTSAARIFAKALNCLAGPSPVPCNQCETCRSISSGDDVDVLEVDGASNRGIDEIRQLRQNVGVRPSRSRLKIYIIDEVHMLTREAFNALLKTLEEPPEHVKFIFCTTEPNKVPVTILSRCQRYDFAGIETGSIARRLGQIVASEGVEAEPDAIEVLARRAAGSMRDGQSLLEQLLSFAPERITLDDVHGMLGTAGDELVGKLLDHLVARDAAGALADLDAALAQGVDAGLLMEQLFGYLRDCMAAAVGCPGEAFLYVSPSTRQRVIAAGKQLGLQTILAAMQIVDQSLSRLRQSTQTRLIAELAIVRICALDDLDELGALVAEFRSGLPAAGSGPAAAQKKKPDAPLSARSVSERDPRTASPQAAPPRMAQRPQSAPAAMPAPTSSPVPLTPQNAAELWSEAVSRCSGMLAESAKQAQDVAIIAPNRLAVRFRSEYTLAKSMCERPDSVARFQQVLAELTGQRVGIEFGVSEDAGQAAERSSPPRSVSPRQRLIDVAEHPLVRRAQELFGAEPTRVIDPPKT